MGVKLSFAILLSALCIASAAPGTTGLPVNEFHVSGPDSGNRGQQISLVVDGSWEADLKGYSVCLRTDADVFEFVSLTLAGTVGENALMSAANHTDSTVTVGVVYSYVCPPSIPAGSGHLLLLTLRVREDAPGGPTVIDLADLSPSLNRMAPCSGPVVAPALTDLGFTVQLPEGACCHQDGTCSLTAEGDCVPPETWQGPGTVCEPNPCPQPVGACCNLLTGFCKILAANQCQSVAYTSWYGGDFVPCSPNPCPAAPTVWGACLCGDRTCRIVRVETCARLRGAFLGKGSVCRPKVNAELTAGAPSGVCCTEDGSCRLLSEEDCTVETGAFLGGYDCAPGPCSGESTVKVMTWGSIKRGFRDGR